MRVLVSDASVLIELSRWSLLDVMFRLPYEFAVPDALYEDELIDLGRYDRESLKAAGMRVESLDPNGAGASEKDDVRSVKDVSKPSAAPAAPVASLADVLSLYDVFLLKLEDETRAGAVKPDLLQDQLGLCRTQLQDWLKRAVEEGRAEKLKSPVRYRHIGR